MTEDTQVIKKFREILRGSKSTQEISEKIDKEAEPLRSKLLERYEHWRVGDLSRPHLKILDSWFVDTLFDTALRFFLFSSPLIGLILNTLKALKDRFWETNLLQDPGHRRIRIYDDLIAFVSLVAGIFIVLVANSFDLNTLFEGRVLFIILFPQLSGWSSFFVLYGISTLLHFYDAKRSDLIVKINEQQGAW